MLNIRNPDRTLRFSLYVKSERKIKQGTYVPENITTYHRPKFHKLEIMEIGRVTYEQGRLEQKLREAKK